MKQILKKTVVMLLTLIIVVNIVMPAYAGQGIYKSFVSTQEEIELAIKTYKNLSPKAKAIFEKSLSYDLEMLKFHQTYVDKNFVPDISRIQLYSSTVADPMQILSVQLAGIGLPSAVVYSLKAMGAGMVAAIADGPLPIGDILLAAATVSAVAVIAANWDAVSPKFNRIVAAFNKAFSGVSSNISAAFSKIKGEAKQEAERQKGGTGNNNKNNDEKNFYHLTASEFISKFRKASVRREFPSQMLEKTVLEIQALARSGSRVAKTAWKLLTDGRFKK